MTNFGWDYPPGVSESDLEEPPEEPQECEECGGTGEIVRIIGELPQHMGGISPRTRTRTCESCDGEGVVYE